MSTLPALSDQELDVVTGGLDIDVSRFRISDVNLALISAQINQAQIGTLLSSQRANLDIDVRQRT
jgi:hypothetical protein